METCDQRSASADQTMPALEAGKPEAMFDIAREGVIIRGVAPFSKTPSAPVLTGGVRSFLGHG